VPTSLIKHDLDFAFLVDPSWRIEVKERLKQPGDVDRGGVNKDWGSTRLYTR
jgi:hypothetical protein